MPEEDDAHLRPRPNATRLPPWRIRPALASEADALSHLARQAKAYWGYAEEDLARWESALRTTPQQMASCPTFVAESAAGLLGFVQIDPGQTPWELTQLWVHSARMRQGLGRALLTHALAVATQAGQTRLRVDADPHAEAFYRACGARRVGTVAAPLAGDPARVRPQLEMATTRPGKPA
jgi:ribosomal protein S18 acetylase RimI-like enzyme